MTKPNSELAIETLKNPYIVDFIFLIEDMNERDIENHLVKKITKHTYSMFYLTIWINDFIL